MPDNFAITEPDTGTSIRAVNVGGNQHQVVVVADAAGDMLAGATREDTYAANGDGTTLDLTAKPCKYFSVQVISEGGTATVWNVDVQISLDGTNWFTLFSHATADTLGKVKAASTPTPALYVRTVCSGTLTLSGATDIKAILLAMP